MRRGLVSSRERAREAIEAGTVTVSGTVASKPARLVGAGEPIVIAGPRARFVGRGGDKLAAALEEFPIAVQGRRALDAGASTGGFTDCLLQAGAASVLAVDVGRNQLHERLKADPRVESRERTDIRDVALAWDGPLFEIVVADLSFISLRSVAPALLALAAPRADLVVLVKPQFEAGRAEVSKGRGVVSDPIVWRRVLGEARDTLEGLRAAIMGVMASPLRGADGNVEFLLHALAPSDSGVTAAPRLADAVLDAVVAGVPVTGRSGA